MIEMLGVLAIIGVLSVGGIMGYSTAMENYRVNKYINDIETFGASALHMFGKTNPTRLGFETVRLCQLGIVTGDYCNNKSPFTGASSGIFLALGYQGERGSKVNVLGTNLYMRNLPLSVCAKLLAHPVNAPAVRKSLYNSVTNAQPFFNSIATRHKDNINAAYAFCKEWKNSGANTLSISFILSQ